ncbi:hypothetical protein [Nocardia sp. NPDC051570]|uniref:hypothetical protein n=1 Tax=Nocardia sp. NPDC051570 TaxID=3364324 RepID=UPI0037B990D8
MLETIMFGNHPASVTTSLADSQIGTTNLLDWLTHNGVTVMLVIVGIVMLAASMRAHMSKVVSVGACAIIALAFIVLGNNGGMQTDVGNWLWHLVHAA